MTGWGTLVMNVGWVTLLAGVLGQAFFGWGPVAWVGALMAFVAGQVMVPRKMRDQLAIVPGGVLNSLAGIVVAVVATLVFVFTGRSDPIWPPVALVLVGGGYAVLTWASMRRALAKLTPTRMQESVARMQAAIANQQPRSATFSVTYDVDGRKETKEETCPACAAKSEPLNYLGGLGRDPSTSDDEYERQGVLVAIHHKEVGNRWTAYQRGTTSAEVT